MIGNPPYIEAKKLKFIANTLKCFYNIYSGTADLSIYFIELGLGLLKPTGILSYITTNKFFNTGYGQKVRELVSSKEINKIINFEQVEVFEGILVSSVILEVKKVEASINKKITYEKFYRLKARQFKESFIEHQKSFGAYPQSILNGAEWSFANTEGLLLKAKIEKGSQKLEDINGVDIYRGVTTGYNPAFIISNEQKDYLLSEDSNNKRVIKNMLQGRNIRRWFYNESDENLIFIPWHFPLNNDSSIKGASNIAEDSFRTDYPSIYNRFLSHKTKLEERNLDETGIRYEWYALQRCAASYYDKFEKSEKIIWGLTADKWAFTLDTEQHYLPSNGYILTSEVIPTKYILGVLNSKLLQHYFGYIGIMTAGGAYTLKAATISSLPFKITDDTNPVITIVDKILQTKAVDHNADINLLEMKLNTLVYNIYGISEAEILIIEGK